MKSVENILMQIIKRTWRVVYNATTWQKPKGRKPRNTRNDFPLKNAGLKGNFGSLERGDSRRWRRRNNKTVTTVTMMDGDGSMMMNDECDMQSVGDRRRELESRNWHKMRKTGGNCRCRGSSPGRVLAIYLCMQGVKGRKGE
jgi:hypothetical protein